MKAIKIIITIVVFVTFCNSQVLNKKIQDKNVIEYLKKSVLEKPEDIQYVEIRNSSRRIKSVYSSATKIVFSGKLASNNDYYVKITSIAFNRNRHKIEMTVPTEPNEASTVSKIDNLEFYGTDGSLPQTEIDTFDIVINKNTIKIPRDEYSIFYNPSFSTIQHGHEYVEIYESINSKYLYIYMDGSDGAGGYSVKWILSKDGYVTKMVSTNETVGSEVLDGIARDEGVYR